MGVALAVLLLTALLLGPRVDLAAGQGWYLGPQAVHPFAIAAVVPAAGLLLLTALAFGWLLRRGEPSRRGAAAGVLLLWLLSWGLQLTCEAGLGRQRWFVNTVAATWSNLSNGYFWEAKQLGPLRPWLAAYLDRQRADTMKIATHPPGAVLVYWVPLQLAEHLPLLELAGLVITEWATAGQTLAAWREIREPPNVPRELGVGDLPATVFAVLWVAALGAGAVVPCYLLGAADGSRRTGLLAAALLATAPNLAFYYLAQDALLMTLTAWALVGVQVALRRQVAWPAMLAGVALGGALLVSVGAAASTVLTVSSLLTARPPAKVGGRVLAGLIGGGGAVLLLVTLLGLDTGAVYAQCLTAHREGGGGIGHRHYLPWLVLNLVTYAALAGLPLVWAAVEAVARRELRGTAAAVGIAGLTVLLLLNASGMVKGETERLWLFLNPTLAVAAAAGWQGRADRVWPLLWQPLQLLLLLLTLPPLVRPY